MNMEEGHVTGVGAKSLYYSVINRPNMESVLLDMLVVRAQDGRHCGSPPDLQVQGCDGPDPTAAD